MANDTTKTVKVRLVRGLRGAQARHRLSVRALGLGEVQVIEIARPRYVGARIGIHNPKGEKVGTVGRLRNVEHLFVVTDRPVDLSLAA